jgi:mono/diheme cytochrome c family protein
MWFGTAVAAVALAIQVVPYGRNHANPPVTREPAWDSHAARELAKRACFDCHSNETEWPVYASIAPVSWLVQHDVTEGRGVLNFSEWHRAQEGAKDASEEVLQREMPPVTYRFVHAHARLTAAEMERLANGLVKTMGVLAAEEQQEREQ